MKSGFQGTNGRLVLAKLRKTPGLQVEVFLPQNTEQLLERFNQILSDISIEDARNPENSTAPRRVLLVRTTPGMQCTRFVRDYFMPYIYFIRSRLLYALYQFFSIFALYSGVVNHPTCFTLIVRSTFRTSPLRTLIGWRHCSHSRAAARVVRAIIGRIFL